MGKTFKDRLAQPHTRHGGQAVTESEFYKNSVRPPEPPAATCAVCGQLVGKTRYLYGGTPDECCSQKCFARYKAEMEAEA
jgi:hypothetical protein